jgi:hypothetical protein
VRGVCLRVGSRCWTSNFNFVEGSGRGGRGTGCRRERRR